MMAPYPVMACAEHDAVRAAWRRRRIGNRTIQHIVVLLVAGIAFAGCGSGSSAPVTASATQHDSAAYAQGVVAAEKEMVANTAREHISVDAEERADERAVAGLSEPARLAAYSIDIVWARALISKQQLPTNAVRYLTASYETGKSEPAGSPQYGPPTPGLGPFIAGQGARLQVKFARTLVYDFLVQCEGATIALAELSEAPTACNMAGASLGLYPAALSPSAAHDCAAADAVAQQVSAGLPASKRFSFPDAAARFAIAVADLVSAYPALSRPFASDTAHAEAMLRDITHKGTPTVVIRRDLRNFYSALRDVEAACV